MVSKDTVGGCVYECSPPMHVTLDALGDSVGDTGLEESSVGADLVDGCA